MTAGISRGIMLSGVNLLACNYGSNGNEMYSENIMWFTATDVSGVVILSEEGKQKGAALPSFRITDGLRWEA